jgi:hypothetical protein
MAGIRGRSGPPGNQNAFRHGLAGIAQRRVDGVLNPAEQSVREEILAGLLADKGGVAQISTAMRVLAEIIASDVSLLVTFNDAIDGVIQNNLKARANPKALAQLDGYKTPLGNSLSMETLVIDYPVGAANNVRTTALRLCFCTLLLISFSSWLSFCARLFFSSVRLWSSS